MMRTALDRMLVDSVLLPSRANTGLLDALLGHPCRQGPQAMRYRPCPACGTLVHRHLQGGCSAVITDSCRDHGVWLDVGEFRQLMEWQRAGGSLLDGKHRAQRDAERGQRLRQELRDVAAATATLPEPSGWSGQEEPSIA